MKLADHLNNIYEFGSPEEIEFEKAQKANAEKDLDAMAPKLKSIVKDLFGVELSDPKAKGSKDKKKYVMKGDYNGVKNGFEFVVWVNPQSSYMEFNFRIKDNIDKLRDKIFDKGNKEIQKLLKNAKHGRSFFYSPRLEF